MFRKLNLHVVYFLFYFVEFCSNIVPYKILPHFPLNYDDDLSQRASFASLTAPLEYHPISGHPCISLCNCLFGYWCVFC